VIVSASEAVGSRELAAGLELQSAVVAEPAADLEQDVARFVAVLLGIAC
jgi:hypothetical protein